MCKIVLFVTLLFSLFNDDYLKLRNWIIEGDYDKVEALEISKTALTKQQANEIIDICFSLRKAIGGDKIYREINNRVMYYKGFKMPFYYRYNGEKPKDGYSMFISMHGGGECKPEVNDKQYRNQKYLYNPSQSLYFVPRAPTNTYNLFERPYMDYFLNHIIDMAVNFMDVNPDKIYIMGYSAGGGGAYQMGSRMADRWAAVASMAGHPGVKISAISNFRNTAFASYTGELDTPYDRNKLARKWGNNLDSLSSITHGDYPHKVVIYPDLGHWMERRDTAAISWMLKYQRTTYPKNVDWTQCKVLTKSFYWLECPINEAKFKGRISASYDKNKNAIAINDCYVNTLILNLNDKMLDLDKKVKVYYKGKKVFDGMVKRSFPILWRKIREKWDRGFIYYAQIKLQL